MKFFITFLLLFSNFQASAFSQVISTCSKDGALISIEEESHKILFENNSQKLIYPASLVKMMTTYLTFEALHKNQLTLHKELTFSSRAQEVSKVNKVNTLDVKEGNKITIEKALQALIVKSYNEASIVLAEAISDNEWSFVRQMNKKALELGMINTSFRNAKYLIAPSNELADFAKNWGVSEKKIKTDFSFVYDKIWSKVDEQIPSTIRTVLFNPTY